MAENLHDLRRRITSVKNTRKITQAMKAVSAAKLRRSISELNRLKPMLGKIEDVLGRVGKSPEAAEHPFLEEREQGDTFIVAISSDKGLCGAFNSHIIEKAVERFEQIAEGGEQPSLIIVGKKIHKYFSKKNYHVDKSYDSLMAGLSYPDAKALSAFLQEIYLNEKKNIKKIEFIYTAFTSASQQEIVTRSLFPIAAQWQEEEAEEETGSSEDIEYIFEPSAVEIFQSLLPLYIDSLVYRVLLDSSASEHAARMIAMDLATRNAGDMIKGLTLTLNKLRQASITNELLEIITATEALKK
ncbi:MAG: ATP synthase F1 subunit gamma [Candidatus Aminicenantes bacterium]|nr:ATP synthase F1 subunit gamma [Candidatus Aminicenantes bacterium]